MFLFLSAMATLFLLPFASLYSLFFVVGRRIYRGQSPFTSIGVEIVVFMISFLSYRLNHSLLNALGKHAQVPKHLATLTTDMGTWINISSNQKKKKTILFCHGGGFCLMNAVSLVNGLECLLESLGKEEWQIFSVEYPIAPASKYPSQLEFTMDALQYVHSQPNVSDLYFAGDSAGGNLIISLLLKIAQDSSKSQLMPKAVIALSPWLDLGLKEYPLKEYDVLSSRFLLECAASYATEEQAQSDILVSPLRASPEILKLAFCKTKIILAFGGLEVFKSDILKFAEKIKASGCGENQVRIDEDPTLPHDYHLMVQLFGKSSLTALDRVAAWINSI